MAVQIAERVECGSLVPLWYCPGVAGMKNELTQRNQASALHTLRVSETAQLTDNRRNLVTLLLTPGQPGVNHRAGLEFCARVGQVFPSSFIA
jgi:hypothetical protein